MTAHYIPTEQFHTAADKIANLEPCPFAGRVTVDQVKIAIGEALDVWPEAIRADVKRYNRK